MLGLSSNKMTDWNESISVWPDLAKILHLGKMSILWGLFSIFQNFNSTLPMGNFSSLYLNGQILNHLGSRLVKLIDLNEKIKVD